jgi:hypothetical protein
MSGSTRRTQMGADMQEHYRTGSPVIVRPMTRRWISDVPSKMVKIFGLDFSPQATGICAGEAVYASALPGLERTGPAPSDPSVLPAVLPDSGWRGMPSYDPRTYPPLPVECPPLLRQMWSELKARAGQKVLNVVVLAVLLGVTYPIVAWVAAWYEAHQ